MQLPEVHLSCLGPAVRQMAGSLARLMSYANHYAFDYRDL